MTGCFAWRAVIARVERTSFEDAFRGRRHDPLLWWLAADLIGRENQSLDVMVDRFAFAAQREHKVRIVRLGGPAVRAFINHQVAAARLYRQLESFHGFLDLYELLRCLLTGERNSEPGEPVRNILRNTLHVVIGSEVVAGLGHGPLSASSVLVRSFVPGIGHTSCYTRIEGTEPRCRHAITAQYGNQAEE